MILRAKNLGYDNFYLGHFGEIERKIREADRKFQRTRCCCCLLLFNLQKGKAYFYLYKLNPDSFQSVIFRLLTGARVLSSSINTFFFLCLLFCNMTNFKFNKYRNSSTSHCSYLLSTLPHSSFYLISDIHMSKYFS